MSEKLQQSFMESIKDLNKYSFDIIDQTLINDMNVEEQLPCNKCDGDCCGAVPFKYKQVLDIFNKYTNPKNCSLQQYKDFKKRFPYTSETSLKKNVQFRQFFQHDRDSVVIEFINKNKVRKLGFSEIDCIFKRDPKTGGCLIYEDRPLACRAYGKKYSLQCPYKGLEEQPKDEAKKKTLVMNNNGALKDTIELKKLMFSKG